MWKPICRIRRVAILAEIRSNSRTPRELLKWIGYKQSSLSGARPTRHPKNSSMFAKIQAAGRTDVGRKRETNQDQFLIADLSKSMLVQSTSLNLEPRSRLYGLPQGRLFVVAMGWVAIKRGIVRALWRVDYLINKLLNNIHVSINWIRSRE